MILALTGAAIAAGLGPAIDAQQAPPAGSCRISGKSTSGPTALPGVSIVITAGGAVKGVTSTDPDGTYRLAVMPGTYTMSAELTGFARVERELALEPAACDRVVDLPLALAPRQARAAGAPATSPAGQRGAASSTPRFETLTAETQAAAAAGLEVNPPEATDAATRLLLPPGFSTEAPTQAVAINGNMASLDRGMMNERMDAIGRGEFDPTTGEFGQGFGPGGQGGFGGPGGPGGFGGRGGRDGGPGGGPGGPGGPGGRGGPGGFVLGGRGRGQRAYSLQSNYTFSGSALDSAPYELRPGSAQQQNPYNRQNFGVTVGGP
ncbi:MAG TPA: carboxypeptidase regulatory-like domain-containing protein, partial [Vicinamibacterales bacterium]